jgi:hypothetical protein
MGWFKKDPPSDEPRGEEVEIKADRSPMFGTRDPRRDHGRITGRDETANEEDE